MSHVVFMPPVSAKVSDSESDGFARRTSVEDGNACEMPLTKSGESFLNRIAASDCADLREKGKRELVLEALRSMLADVTSEEENRETLRRRAAETPLNDSRKSSEVIEIGEEGRQLVKRIAEHARLEGRSDMIVEASLDELLEDVLASQAYERSREEADDEDVEWLSHEEFWKEIEE